MVVLEIVSLYALGRFKNKDTNTTKDDEALIKDDNWENENDKTDWKMP